MSGTTEKVIAMAIAPRVCPVNRAVPCMAPAAPLRALGADRSRMRLFGVWNRPKPSPATTVPTMKAT